MTLTLNMSLLPQRFPQLDVPPIPCLSCAIGKRQISKRIGTEHHQVSAQGQNRLVNAPVVIGQTPNSTEVVPGEVLGSTLENHCQFGQVAVNSIAVLLVPGTSCAELFLETVILVIFTPCLGAFKLVAYSYWPALNCRQMLLRRFQRIACLGFGELNWTGFCFLTQLYETEPAFLAFATQVLRWRIGSGFAS